jgi:hypothetical protein
VSFHQNASLFTLTPPSYPTQPFPFQIIVATFLAGYPILEATLSTFRRGVKRFLFNRSMEGAEKEHIHHCLLRSGFPAPAICLIAVLFQTILTLSALLVLSGQRALAVWILVPLLVFLSYAMPRMGFFNFLDFRVIRNNHPHYQIIHYFIFMQRAKLDLAEDREEVLALLSQTCAELGVETLHVLVKSDRGENGRCHFFWERKEDIAREYLNYVEVETGQDHLGHFQDQIVLAGNQGEADWIFEPHPAEAELDVEYRVAVSDFMKDALARICSLKNLVPGTDPKIEIGPLSHARVRSSLLRRKHAHSTEAAV